MYKKGKGICHGSDNYRTCPNTLERQIVLSEETKVDFMYMEITVRQQETLREKTMSPYLAAVGADETDKQPGGMKAEPRG